MHTVSLILPNQPQSMKLLLWFISVIDEEELKHKHSMVAMLLQCIHVL